MTGTQLATQRVKQLITVIDERIDELAKSLPAHRPAEKFIRVVKTAIQMHPEIADCNPRDVFIECQKCASDGLLLDGREAVMLTYMISKKVKDPQTGQEKWNKRRVPKYIPMYQGLIKRARNTGELRTITAYLYYENEMTTRDETTGRFRFEHWIDDAGEHILHVPMLPRERGAVAGVYSLATLRGGLIDRCVMTIEEVRVIEARSKSKDRQGNIVGPWKTDEGEMIKKTCIRRHSKTLPTDSDLARVFERDDDLYETPDFATEQPPTTPRKRSGAAAAALNGTIEARGQAQHEEQPDEDGVFYEEESENPAPSEQRQKPAQRKRAAPKPAAAEAAAEDAEIVDEDEFSGDDVI